ncbi:MAG TPA: trypsin-like peptidase domain-containing protein [bacterium]
METVQGISKALADAVDSVGRSIVRVEGRRGRPGSGLVWSADGVVVTADHVLERDEDIRVALPDGTEVQATIAGRDATTDIAILRTDTKGQVPAPWTSLDGVRVGHLILALSRPGRTVRARLGVINALGEKWRAPSGAELDHYVEADVELAWGFSGGALVDLSGKVIGMTTTGLNRAPLAIPQASLQTVAAQLLSAGRIRRGFLGIGSHPVRLPAAVREQLGQRLGLIVVAVEPGSPAERGGLTLGDVLVAIEGAPLRHPGDVAARLGSDAVGKSLSVRILRGGVFQDLAITVGER